MSVVQRKGKFGFRQIIFSWYNFIMETPVKKSGYIYFLLSEKMDAVKIGFTRGKIEKRLREWKTWHPYDFDVLKVLEGTMIEERLLHRRFWKDKIRGEWFRYSEELKEYIDSL